jgi:hypothetical protein
LAPLPQALSHAPQLEGSLWRLVHAGAPVPEEGQALGSTLLVHGQLPASQSAPAHVPLSG